MTLPTASNRSRDPASAVAVPATPAAARITTVEWPIAKNRPTPTGRLPCLHQLAGHVVDRRDMVGVDRVTQAEPIG